jgi:hypothetical protein
MKEFKEMPRQPSGGLDPGRENSLIIKQDSSSKRAAFFQTS